MQRLLELIASVGGVKTSTGTPEQARAGYALMLAQSPAPDDGAGPIARVEDRTIPGPVGAIPLRIYRPRRDGPVPTVLFFHGGGWVIGSIETHDAQSRLVCEGTGAVVVSVEYRLAPEHPFPAALDDCTEATDWAADNLGELGGEGMPLAVAGPSAGGNLAAAVSMRAREPWRARARRPTPDVSGHRRIAATPSYAENGQGYFLEAETMGWFWDHYLAGRAPTPESSVLDAADHSALPPAVIVTAEYDPLRDEGNAYADRLRAAGVPVTLVECRGSHPRLLRHDHLHRGRGQGRGRASSPTSAQFSRRIRCLRPLGPVCEGRLWGTETTFTCAGSPLGGYRTR